MNPAICPYCGLEWKAEGAAHCRKVVDGVHCCAHFSTVSAAEQHWIRGEHVDPQLVPKLQLRADGVWTVKPTASRQAWLDKQKAEAKN